MYFDKKIEIVKKIFSFWGQMKRIFFQTSIGGGGGGGGGGGVFFLKI